MLSKTTGVATAVLTAGAIAMPLSAQELEPVTLRLAFIPGGVDAPTFMAKCSGLFENHGLDVTIMDGNGSTGTIQAVGNGTVDVGIASLGALAQASAAAGFDNIIAVAGLVQKDPTSIISLKGSGITSPKDLEGKRFAVSAGNRADGLIDAFADANGIDMSTIDVIVTDAYKNALLRGDADFINAWANPDGDQVAEYAEIEEPMLFADHGVNVLGSSVIVRTDYLAAHGEDIRGLLAAITEGHDAVLADPEAALECFMDERPDSDSEAIAHQIEVMEKYRKTSNSQELPFGHVHPDDLAGTIAVLEKYSGMPVGVAKPELLYDGSYLPD